MSAAGLGGVGGAGAENLAWLNSPAASDGARLADRD